MPKKIKVAIGKTIWKLLLNTYPFNGDPLLKKTFCLLVEKIKPQAIIETGTYHGGSTSFIAKEFPNIPVYTCEIKESIYKKAAKLLGIYKNTEIYLDTSSDFLKKIIKEKELSNKRVVFFLDAHWYDDWPLEKEIEIITNEIKSAVILIDDFKIPNNMYFHFDKYNNKECSLELIKPRMNINNEYNMIFPNYTEGRLLLKYISAMSGYVFIFQNLKSAFNRFLEQNSVKEHFTNGRISFEN